jgi:hypothetical protein
MDGSGSTASSGKWCPLKTEPISTDGRLVLCAHEARYRSLFLFACLSDPKQFNAIVERRMEAEAENVHGQAYLNMVSKRREQALDDLYLSDAVFRERVDEFSNYHRAPVKKAFDGEIISCKNGDVLVWLFNGRSHWDGVHINVRVEEVHGDVKDWGEEGTENGGDRVLVRYYNDGTYDIRVLPPPPIYGEREWRESRALLAEMTESYSGLFDGPEGDD